MALNGSIGWSSGGSYNSWGIYVTWSATQNIAGNYSDVTASVSIRSTNSGSWFQRDTDIWLSINGSSDHKVFSNLRLNPNSTVPNVYSRTVRVPHDTNGEKSFSLSASMSNATVGTVSVSGSGSLKPIARVSTLDWNTSDFPHTYGKSLSFTVNSGSSDFYHSIEVRTRGVLRGAPLTNSRGGGSKTFTIPIDWLNAAVDTQVEPCSFRLITHTKPGSYAADSLIGFVDYSGQIHVPDNIVPTISNVTYADKNTTVAGITGSDQILVQNKSIVQLTTTANGIYGSTIKEYNVSIAGLSFTSTSNVQTIDLSQYTIGAGSIVATITVTDSRGRKASIDVTLNVQAYSPPTLKNFKVTRNMNLNTTINIVKTVAVSSIKNGTTEKNTYTIVTKYKKTVDSAWITAKTETNTSANFALTGMAIESSYDVQVTITDKLSAPVTVQSSVPSIFMIMSWSATTVGIGKAAEQGVLDIAGKLSDIYVGGISLLDLQYPINSVYQSFDPTDPSILFGGTWTRIAKGQTLIGVDESDSDFATAGKTGGEKTHKLDTSASKTANEIGATSVGKEVPGSGDGLTITSRFAGRVAVFLDKTIEANPHNNLQPYITLYIWRRTA